MSEKILIQKDTRSPIFIVVLFTIARIWIQPKCPSIERNRRVPLISDSDRRIPADWGQESQASSWVEAWNSACLSRCPRGERPLVELYLEPGVFSERCMEKLPIRVDFIHRVDPCNLLSNKEIKPYQLWLSSSSKLNSSTK